MMRIAGGVLLALLVFALLCVAALKVKRIFEEEEADSVGALIVVLIVIVGSIAAYFLTSELL